MGKLKENMLEKEMYDIKTASHKNEIKEMEVFDQESFLKRDKTVSAGIYKLPYTVSIMEGREGLDQDKWVGVTVSKL